jgi:hypothetical protein
LSNLVGHITTQIRQVESSAYQSVDALWATLSNSFVVYTGDKILVLDSLPKESAVNVIKIGNSGISYSTQGINGLFKQIVGINGTLMLAGQEIKDAIIDEGTSGYWTYKKYKNGTCECDATISLSPLSWSSYISYEKITDVTTTPPTTQTIDLLFKASKSIDLPFNVTGAKATAQVTGSTIAWTTNVQEQANSVTIGLVAKTQSSSMTVNVHVSGAWS